MSEKPNPSEGGYDAGIVYVEGDQIEAPFGGKLPPHPAEEDRIKNREPETIPGARPHRMSALAMLWATTAGISMTMAAWAGGDFIALVTGLGFLIAWPLALIARALELRNAIELERTDLMGTELIALRDPSEELRSIIELIARTSAAETRTATAEEVKRDALIALWGRLRKLLDEGALA